MIANRVVINIRTARLPALSKRDRGPIPLHESDNGSAEDIGQPIGHFAANARMW